MGTSVKDSFIHETRKLLSTRRTEQSMKIKMVTLSNASSKITLKYSQGLN